MSRRPLALQRPVFVVGIGLHPYSFPTERPYVEIGLPAVREALADAGLAWPAVESAYVGTALLGMAAGRAMLRYLGATGLAVAQVENASASGSTAFRMACLEVASGSCDVAAAIGVDKPGEAPFRMSWTGAERLATLPPPASFALIADEYMRRHGVRPEQLAQVAVKNHGNAAHNPYAQLRKPRTLEEVMAHPVAGALTRLQCCPFGEGAAAVLVASEEALARHGLDARRAVRVAASVATSERLYEPGAPVVVELTRETAARALDEAGWSARELDVVELHDAFSIEELLYAEALGLCAEGEGAAWLESGASRIGGSCAVSPSGGLLAMGHPFGPTGVGQVAEIARQLRGEAGERQQPRARRGLAHMVGIGQVCVVHLLEGVG